MNVAEGMLRAVWQYAGFFLLPVLFSEEFRRLVSRAWQARPQQPGLKFLFYPLAVLLAAGAAVLIANSFITLFGTVFFSYE